MSSSRVLYSPREGVVQQRAVVPSRSEVSPTTPDIIIIRLISRKNAREKAISICDHAICVGVGDTDLGESLLRVQYLNEQRDLIIHDLEAVPRLRQQLLYRLRRGERRRRARRRRGAPRAGAAGVAVVKMRAAEEDGVAIRRDAACERSKGEPVERGAGTRGGCTKQALSGGQG